MAIEEIPLDLSGCALSRDAAAFLAEANRRIDELFATERNKRTPKFLPSDPELLHAALTCITRRNLPLGRVYCEWGSGVGVGVGLASLLGYEAFGIEIEPSLVRFARKLAHDTGVAAQFLEGSYLPEGFESYSGMGGEELVLPEHFLGGSSGLPHFAPTYEGMPCPTDEIDVFFVFPWPGEQEFMQQLFEILAGDGAILLVYYGGSELCAYQKTAAAFL